jgi:hypothetical protein
MANPVQVFCPEGTWKKVAINIRGANLCREDTSPNLYLYTYRLTGEAEPTSRLEGVPIFIGSVSEEINSPEAIDIYIMCIGSDGKVIVGNGTGLSLVAEGVSILENHFINRELWYGKKAVQTATEWADEFALTSYRAISGNADFGSDPNDEAQLIGTGDMPIFAGQTAFKVFRIMVSDSSSATPYLLRFIWSLTTMADGLIADQYTSLMISFQDFSMTPFDLVFPRLENGYKVWCQCKNSVDNATIDFFVGAFGF